MVSAGLASFGFGFGGNFCLGGRRFGFAFRWDIPTSSRLQFPVVSVPDHIWSHPARPTPFRPIPVVPSRSFLFHPVPSRSVRFHPRGLGLVTVMFHFRSHSWCRCGFGSVSARFRFGFYSVISQSRASCAVPFHPSSPSGVGSASSGSGLVVTSGLVSVNFGFIWRRFRW